MEELLLLFGLLACLGLGFFSIVYIGVKDDNQEDKFDV